MNSESAASVEPGGIVVRASSHSDRGTVRTLNEDDFLAAHPVYVVADGMGGHAHGDRASRAAIAAFRDLLGGVDRVSPEQVLDTVQQANTNVRAISREPGEERATSGTTLAGVALVRAGPAGDGHWMAFNVGDSRIYSWDGRHLVQLSVDHSVVQELVDAGSITRLEAMTHPSRNVVTRALGAAVDVDPDVWMLPATGRQTFLICSDGLTKELIDDEIARIIVFHDSMNLDSDAVPRSLAERLVGAAVAAGGLDNVTVVVVESEGAVERTLVEATGDRDSHPSFLEDTRPRSER